MSATAVPLPLDDSERGRPPAVAVQGSTRVATRRPWLPGAAIGALALAGAAFVVGGAYTHDNISDQLAAQQIYFPPADSPAMDSDHYPGLQQYGGQLLDTGPEAKAWADQFMTPHIAEVGDGEPYGAVSLMAFQNPDDAALQLKATKMGRGEVQRGLLLSAWGWWVVGSITKAVGMAMLAAAAICAVALVAVTVRRRRTVA